MLKSTTFNTAEKQKTRLANFFNNKDGGYDPLIERILAYYVRGSIAVRLTSCFTCLDSAALFMLNWKWINLFGRIQTSQTGYQPYSDTSPNIVSEYSLLIHSDSPMSSICVCNNFEEF